MLNLAHSVQESRPAEVALPVRLGPRVVRALPDRVARRFVRPVHADGQTLAAQMHYVLWLRRFMRVGPGREPARMRADHRRAVLGVSGPPAPVGSVTDLTLDAPAGPMTARLYAHAGPAGGSAPPLLVYFHGGGFAVGDLDSADRICRLLCRHARVQVLSVDYRLAPEHPFPAAVEDADFAFRWAQARAEQLGADADRVAVAGDSSGGTLAAVVSRHASARRRDDPSAPVPAAQLLVYPAMHANSDAPSRRAFAKGFFLEQEDLDWFLEAYVSAGTAAMDHPDVSPLLADDVAGLPPAVIVTAGLDPLRDEAEAYAARLSDAGVPVVLRREPGMLHGFFSMAGLSRAALDAVITAAGSLAALLAVAS